MEAFLFLTISKDGVERLIESEGVSMKDNGDFRGEYMSDSNIELPKGWAKRILGYDPPRPFVAKVRWEDGSLEEVKDYD